MNEEGKEKMRRVENVFSPNTVTVTMVEFILFPFAFSAVRGGKTPKDWDRAMMLHSCFLG